MIDQTLLKIATNLVNFCKNNQEEEALNTLYADHAVSIEPISMPGQDNREVSGLAAIRKKHEWWKNSVETHSSNVEGPFLHGTDRFGVIFEIDATNKQANQRMTMRELAIYTVENGKITREEFFYTMPS